MTIKEQLTVRLKEETKAKNKIAIQTIRMILALLQTKYQQKKDLAIKKGTAVDDLTEAESIQALQKFQADTVEEIDAFRKVDKWERVKELELSQAVTASFLPTPMSHAELLDVARKAASETAHIALTMGEAIKLIKNALPEGSATNKQISEAARQVLADTKE